MYGREFRRVCVYRYRYIFFQILFHYRLLQIIEYSSLGYPIHLCCLSVLCECSVTSVQSAFCDPMDCNPPGSPVHEILQGEYWSRLPFPSPGDLPDSGTDPVSLTSPALAGGRFFTTRTAWGAKPPHVFVVQL